MIPSLLVLGILAAVPATLTGGLPRLIATALLAVYGLSVVGFTVVVAALHRRARLALLTGAGAFASHVTFGTALLVGVAGRLVHSDSRSIRRYGECQKKPE